MIEIPDNLLEKYHSAKAKQMADAEVYAWQTSRKEDKAPLVTDFSELKETLDTLIKKKEPYCQGSLKPWKVSTPSVSEDQRVNEALEKRIEQLEIRSRVDAWTKALQCHKREIVTTQDRVERLEKTIGVDETTSLAKKIVDLEAELTVLKNETKATTGLEVELKEMKGKIEAIEQKLISGKQTQTPPATGPLEVSILKSLVDEIRKQEHSVKYLTEEVFKWKELFKSEVTEKETLEDSVETLLEERKELKEQVSELRRRIDSNPCFLEDKEI